MQAFFSKFKYSIFHLLHYFQRVKVKLFTKFIKSFLLIFSIGFCGITVFELGKNDQFDSILDVGYFVLTTMSTVGFGDKTAITAGGKLITICIILLSLGLIAFLSAFMAALFIEEKLKEEMGMKPIKIQDHIVIIGWNMKGRKIIEILHSGGPLKDTEIVIIANEERNPVDDDAVFFVRSQEILDKKTLSYASIEHAKKVIVLADYNIKNGSDMFTATKCLLARSMNKNTQIIVEMLNIYTREYFEISGANSIIGVGEIGGIMITEACYGNTDLASSVTKLTTNNSQD